MRQQSSFDSSTSPFSLPQRSNLYYPPAPPQKTYLWRDKSPWGEDRFEDAAWDWDDEPAPPQSGWRSSTKALAAQPASRLPVVTRQLEAVQMPPADDFHILPALTLPLMPAITLPLQAAPQSPPPKSSGFWPVSSPLKLWLIAMVALIVLAGTYATAGGSKQLSQLFTTVHSSPPSAAAVSTADWPITQHVQPIIQADDNAGYDSQAQHDTWWDSVCAAASFTEVARAWGHADVTLGQVLDRLLAHDPPYITISGGLMSQDGWEWMAQAYGLQAQVSWNAYTFDSLVQQVNTSGMPMVIGMEGGSTASPWGHFVVVTGGDSNQVQIADSSLWKMTSLPRSFFTEPTYGIINDPIWWSGEAVLLTPA